MVNVKDIVDDHIDYSGAARIAEQDFLLLERNNCVPHREDVLFSKDGTIGRVLIFRDEEPVAVLSSLAILRSEDDLDPDFLAHILRSHHTKRQIEVLSSGSALKRIVLQDLAKLAIPRPVVLEEQALIAAILDTVDDAIRYTEQAIAKLKQVRAGLLHDLFTYGINENGDSRDPVRHPEQFKESELGMIPRGWNKCSLKSLYAIPSRNGLYKTQEAYGSGVLMLHMPQMFRGIKVDASDSARVMLTDEEVRRFELLEGDLVFARRSVSYEGAGQCSLIPELHETLAFESSIIRVRLKQHLASSAFVNYFLNSALGFRIRAPLIRQVAVSGVSSEDVGSMEICLPVDIEEQAQIVEILDNFHSTIDRESETVDKLRLLKHGLMDDLLTGRVRVVDLLSQEE